eukprot:6212544-Pleurochrysis_carterae.AAC.5
MEKSVRERDFHPVSRHCLEMLAGYQTHPSHCRTAPPYPARQMAKSLKQHLSPRESPAPAPEVVVHERLAQWGCRSCP